MKLARTPSQSEKLKAAARRNGTLGGRKPIASPDALAKVYAMRKEWNWQDFVAAIKKETGIVYSRTQAFTLLKRLKAPVKFFGGLDEAVPKPVITEAEREKEARDDERARQAIRGKKALRQR